MFKKTLKMLGVLMLMLGIGAAGSLAANVTFIIDGASVGRPYGNFRQLPDAGFLFTVCYTASQIDGGRGLLLSDCVNCEPGGWNAAPATCQAAWRAANGGL